MKRRWIVCLLGLSLAGTLLAGCGQEAPKIEGAVLSADVQEQQGELENEVMEIETSYGTLSYPEQWKDCLDVEQEESEDGVQLIFQAEIEDELYPLFEITIGEGDGEAVGVIQDEDGVSRDVYVKILENEDLEDLSDEEIDRIYAMKEGINDVLDHLADKEE